MSYPFNEALRKVVALLVAGRYADLEEFTGGRRLKSGDIARAVQVYGRRLIEPPPDAYESLDVVRVKDAGPGTWSLRMPLWSLEEGRSDLSLELTVSQRGADYDVQIDDIHVLETQEAEPAARSRLPAAENRRGGHSSCRKATTLKPSEEGGKCRPQGARRAPGGFRGACGNSSRRAEVRLLGTDAPFRAFRGSFRDLPDPFGDLPSSNCNLAPPIDDLSLPSRNLLGPDCDFPRSFRNIPGSLRNLLLPDRNLPVSFGDFLRSIDDLPLRSHVRLSVSLR
jgi:hypothetical protein